MLDDVVAARTGAQEDGRRVARNLQRIARFVVIPAAALMLLGLIAFGIRGGLAAGLPEQTVIPLRSVFNRATLSPLGAMSVGLLALALLPVVSVLYILIDTLLHRHWADAAAAGVVVAILILGILLGHA